MCKRHSLSQKKKKKRERERERERERRREIMYSHLEPPARWQQSQMQAIQHNRELEECDTLHKTTAN
jgi:hypothetical protein